jgi:hypothetical protein
VKGENLQTMLQAAEEYGVHRKLGLSSLTPCSSLVIGGIKKKLIGLFS